MSITHVVVYNKSGQSETHTRLNANDLVRNSGYTYEPGRVFLPTDEPAYKRIAKPAGADPAQQVLDSHGHKAGMEQTSYVAPEQPIVFDAAAGKQFVVATESAPTPVAPRAAPVPRTAPAPVSVEEEVEDEAIPPAPEPAPVVASAIPVEAPAAEEPAAPKERMRRPKKGAE